MLSRTEGIVLKTQDYGESHKIVTILTERHGKLSAIARGANKTNSRLNAVTQLFTKGDYLIYVSKGLSTVQQGQIIHSFRHITADIVKTAYAAYLIEMTEKLFEEKRPERMLYEELSLTLDWINEHEEYLVPIIMYELKMFKQGGFSPVLHHCVICKGIHFPFFFSIREGGLLCSNCRGQDEYALYLKDNVVKLLSTLQNTSLSRVGNISVKKENIHLLRTILDEYYDQYGGFFLKSKRFLLQLNKLEE